MIELWKPIPGFEGFYEAGDLGNIRSVDRRVKYSNGSIHLYKSKVLKPGVDPRGYYIVTLARNGEHRTKPVHRLVLTTFRGLGLEGHVCCHNDGNNQNNRLSNLRWDTRSGNEADKKLHGTVMRGETHPQVKLTEDDVRAIRTDSRSLHSIAKDYPVTYAAISLIKRRKTWAHLA